MVDDICDPNFITGKMHNPGKKLGRNRNLLELQEPKSH